MSYSLIQWWYYSPIFWEIFFLDRVSKIAAYSLVGQRPFIVNKFLSFQFALNKGISWGLFSSNSDWVYLAISTIVFAVLCVLAKYSCDRQKEGQNVMGETLLLAGGFSNFLDRLIYHGVVDFIKISFGRWSFPIFNIADIALTFGAVIILYQFLLGDE